MHIDKNKRTMNIAFFTECWDPQINGVITSIKNLEFELLNRGYNTFIFAPQHNNYHDTQSTIFRQRAIKYYFQPEFNFASMFIHKALKKAKEWNIQLIHSHTEFSMGVVAARVASSLNIPHIFTFHTLWEYYSHYFFWDVFPRSTFRWILSLLYKIPHYFIVPSRKIKTYLEDIMRINGVIEIIPTGLHLDHFYDYKITARDRTAFREKYGIGKTDNVMIFVGRMGREKSIDILIQGLPFIIKNHPDIKLLLIGGGPAVAELKKYARSLAVEKHVIFCGYMPWQDIPLAYKSSDIFVNASTSETQGLVTIEAMASGLPAIVKNDITNLEIINNGKHGLVFNDSQEFAEKVHSLFSQAPLRNELHKKSLTASQKYTVQEFGRRTQEFYGNVFKDFYKKNTIL
ncbi:MAG: glycosyltransferase [Spirochaetales bacterium]|nr:glycosyltransferase [Spirochaetales bacterium]